MFRSRTDLSVRADRVDLGAQVTLDHKVFNHRI